MSWVRIDDGYPDHPKVLPLSDAAFRLDVCAKCWASARGSDGFISKRDLGVIASKLEQPKRAPSLVVDLVDRRLWEVTEGGWKLHDWLDYNPSSDEKANARAAAAERMRKKRLAAQSVTLEVRANNQRTSGVRAGEVHGPRPVPSRPVPDPKDQKDQIPPNPQGGFPSLEPAADPGARKKADAHRHTAITLLNLLNERRRTLRPGCRGLGTQPSNLKHIEARLAECYTAEDLRHVILVWEAKCRRDPANFQYFDAKTPFRADNIAGYIATPIEDAGKGFGAARSPPPSLPQPQRWEGDDIIAQKTRIPTKDDEDDKE